MMSQQFGEQVSGNGAGGGHVPTVLIIGAGISGLLMAHGLKKAGIPYTVFDEEPKGIIRRDWGLSLHWAYPELKSILPPELFAQLKTAQVNPFYDTPEVEALPILNGKTGEVIVKLPFGTNHRLSRKKLRNLCSQGIEIVNSKRLKDIEVSEKDVTVFFQDGTSATGDVVVGTDGARSTVRTYLLGKEKAAVQTLPYEAYFSTAKYAREDALRFRQIHDIHTTAIHPDGLFVWLGLLDVTDPADPEDWTFVFALSGPKGKENGPDVNRLELLKGNAERFAEPFRSALTLLPDDNPVWYIDLSMWETIPWDNRGGRVTLGGDAAHPMTFHRGQGLNNAVRDASQFVLAMEQIVAGKVSLQNAVSDYEAEMQPRGREEVQSSYKNTQMLLDWDNFHKSPLFTKGLKREAGH